MKVFEVRFGPVRESPCWLQRRLLGTNSFTAALFAGLVLATVLVPILATPHLLGGGGIRVVRFAVVFWVLSIPAMTVAFYLYIRRHDYTSDELKDYVVAYPPTVRLPRLGTTRARRVLAAIAVAGAGALILIGLWTPGHLGASVAGAVALGVLVLGVSALGRR